MNVERTSARDPWLHEWLSRQHRTWGDNAPAVDLDLLEYDNGTPVALLEFKHCNSLPQALSPRSSSLAVLAKLATMAGLPAFLVVYLGGPNFAGGLFRVRPLNDTARVFLEVERFADDAPLQEFDFVSFLYALRGRDLLHETSIDPYALDGAPARPVAGPNPLLATLMGAAI